MKILITGGAGFIGSRLSAKLQGEHSVTVYDNLHPQVHDGNPDNVDRLKEAGVPIVKGDICDGQAIRDVVKQCQPEIVIHLAAETGTGQSYDEPVRYLEANVSGTAHLIEAIREHSWGTTKRVVLAGSRSVYGEGAYTGPDGYNDVPAARSTDDMGAGRFVPLDAQGRPLTPAATNADYRTIPASIYASSKLMQEYVLQQGFDGSDVEVGILRLQNVYGPGQSLNNPYTGVLSIFCNQVLSGKGLSIFEDGEITRDFVYVDDVVDAFAKLALVEKCPKDIIDIGSGEATTILDAAHTLAKLLGQENHDIKVTGAFRPGDVRYALADVAAAKKFLDWTPQVSFAQGVAELAKWSKSTLDA